MTSVKYGWRLLYLQRWHLWATLKVNRYILNPINWLSMKQRLPCDPIRAFVQNIWFFAHTSRLSDHLSRIVPWPSCWLRIPPYLFHGKFDLMVVELGQSFLSLLLLIRIKVNIERLLRCVSLMIFIDQNGILRRYPFLHKVSRWFGYSVWNFNLFWSFILDNKWFRLI